MSAEQRKITAEESAELFASLRARFEKNMSRHNSLEWAAIEQRLIAKPEKLFSLHEMEQSGGEPDVAGYDKNDDVYIFMDFSAETPPGRRSLCYDQEALDSRKEHKPVGSAIEMAANMGIEMLNEEQYRALQTLGAFDTKTSSWVVTPPDIRKQGGALFCDRRYNRVFVYHNGAESYYGVRGFRGMLKV